jgi:hypothetical protein
MAAPRDTLEGKVEYAILAELSDGGLEDLANLYCGHEFEEAAGAQVLIECSGGPPIAFGCAPCLKRVRIAIRTNADRDLANQTTVDDPREVHRKILQAVRDVLIDGADFPDRDPIETRLSAQENDFTCHFFTPTDDNESVSGRYFVTETEWECNCTRADVT